MSNHKRLKSVAHSIAHHAVSVLSHVHPHLSEACEELGHRAIEIQLMNENPCPNQFREISPVVLSLKNLKKTFANILEREGFKINDLVSANLEFRFYHGSKDHYCSDCKATLKSTEGRAYESGVNYVGDTIT